MCIEREPEARFIAELVGTKKNIWLGAFKKPNKQWGWVNGMPMAFSYWQPGQPSGGPEDRLEIIGTSGGRWNNAGDHNRAKEALLNKNRGFICEWEF